MDLVKLIGAVQRDVRFGERDGQKTYIVVASRCYDTSQKDLWDALTNAERIPRWFLPVSGELRLGGHFQFEGNAGGRIEVCEAPTRLEVTWGMHGQDSWVCVQLVAESESCTRLTLEHTAHVPEEMWKQFGPGAVGIGWEGGLLGLDQYLGSKTDVDPTTAAQWMASAEGKEFVRGASASWCAASIAAGTDRDEAETAAKACVGFYTGAGA